MNGKKILSLVLAVVVGYIVIKVGLWLLSAIMSLVWWVILLAVGAGVVYALYRGFNNMLTSGRRLT